MLARCEYGQAGYSGDGARDQAIEMCYRFYDRRQASKRSLTHQHLFESARVRPVQDTCWGFGRRRAAAVWARLAVARATESVRKGRFAVCPPCTGDFYHRHLIYTSQSRVFSVLDYLVPGPV